MEKVLIIANSSGGLVAFRQELIIRLKKHFQVVVACPLGNRVEELESLGCKIVETPLERRGTSIIKDSLLFHLYMNIIRRESPALIITYTIKPNIYAGIASRFLKVPFVMNITGLGTMFQNQKIVNKVIIYLYRFASRKAKVVLFENEYNRDVFVNNRIIDKNHTFVLNGAGVNLERYSYMDYPDEQGLLEFLFIGRVMKEKGVNELIEAFKVLQKEHICRLVIVGPYEETNYEQVFKDCEKEGWLTYEGFQKDVHPFIKKCHCFILPSWHEGMANTNLECAACGRPVITSNIPGCKEAIVDGISGLLIEPKNVESIVTQVKRFMSMSHEERKEMGVHGRKHMEKYFDKNIIVNNTINTIFERCELGE